MPLYRERRSLAPPFTRWHTAGDNPRRSPDSRQHDEPARVVVLRVVVVGVVGEGGGDEGIRKDLSETVRRVVLGQGAIRIVAVHVGVRLVVHVLVADEDVVGGRVVENGGGSVRVLGNAFVESEADRFV